mgnify:CR=1 FL=1
MNILFILLSPFYGRLFYKKAILSYCYSAQAFFGGLLGLADQEEGDVIYKRSRYFTKEKFDSILNDCLVQSFSKNGPLNLELILDNMADCEKKATTMLLGK